LDSFLAYAESHRLKVCAAAAALIAVIAYFDALLPDISIGFLYLFPVLISAAALNTLQIIALSIFLAFLRETFDPLHWERGASERVMVVMAAYAMTGFFFSELNQRRRLLADHLAEREHQMQLRREAEMQVRVLIETSPLAILTLDASGCIILANDSARTLLAVENDSLQGRQVDQYLPILYRMLKTQRPHANLRTDVECKGTRQNGEIFLAHVFLSTYHTSAGLGLAAVVWDSSENLRDREGSGLESMMATSRVVIGAICHEIRNLASAAETAHAALGHQAGIRDNESYQVLGSLVQGLEKIASSGLHASSGRDTGATDLGTVLDEARIVIEPSLREAEIDVLWEVGENLPLVQADHHSLLQVLLNLARNARRALEYQPVKQVHISTSLERDLVVVRFRDSGTGVVHPEELFRPFQPGAHSFGLGLYISRAILASYGGGLRYEPQQTGSCFTVELWPVENTV
jgi:PAS domain S-box-containing protein